MEPTEQHLLHLRLTPRCGKEHRPDELDSVHRPWQTATSNRAANSAAFTTPQVTKVTKGGVEVDLPAFNAIAWAARGGDGYTVDGNMWAPDVIYNKEMQKWCMYLSINGNNWYSSIILLTADNIEGPYRYQAPVVISGFQSGTSYKDTDLELVIGTQSTLPSRYNCYWGTRYPNNIDPCVFYDEDGLLWMVYGSWSGGIWMLRLNPETGLRDYDVTYTLTGSGDGITVDPYFGKKVAGGYYVSGEAPYIEYINGYYYLFVTYGGLAAGGDPNDYNNGGYQMRVFRSVNPDGPYTGPNSQGALFTSYALDFGPNATPTAAVTYSEPTTNGATSSLATTASAHKDTTASSPPRTDAPTWCTTRGSRTVGRHMRCACTRCSRTKTDGLWQHRLNTPVNR